MSGLRAVAGERALSVDSEDDARPPEYSDDALALEFARQQAGKLQFVAAWNAWFQFDGCRWARDETILAFDLARTACRHIAQEAERANNNKKIAVAIASAKTVAAVQRLAQSDRRIAATVDQWDSDPFLLNTPDGTIDLRTNKMRLHNAADYITKMTAVSPRGDCVLFRKFMARVTDNDGDLQDFLQRVFGYGLTGSTKEHAVFFCHGDGANGKSTLLNAASEIMGDYAKVSPIDTFTLSNSDRHPTELAALRGARMVTSVETEEGRQWAEARVKALTGGDKISARFMRQDFFEFVPMFKLIIAGNHKPGLRSVDEAIRRRFHLVPFAVRIGPGERDPDLPEKLRAEWPGILRWMIDGCVEWQSRGLCPPAAVSVATDAYLDQQDNIATWISECCTLDHDATELTVELFASWGRWAHASGVEQGKRMAFTDALRKRGFNEKKTKIGMRFNGIHVTPTMTGEGHR